MKKLYYYYNIKEDEQYSCTYKSLIDVKSCIICGSGKALNITYSECVLVPLVIQHARYYVIICGLSGSTIFFYIIS